MRFLRFLRLHIQSLRPYPALFLLALPFAIIEPLKLLAALVFGSGHWMSGLFVMLFAYLLSVLVVEQLFKLVKPKLLMLPWFAVLWKWFVAARHKTIGWLSAKWSFGRS